jgi:D-glycero-D-manno-heptose 1,7-bisphosphate phosphatase
MPEKNKALFLDRDGVINIDRNYVWKIENFDLIPGISDVIKIAMLKNYKIIVITNQAGIGRGMYTEHDFHILSSHMKNTLQKMGCFLDHIYFCPFHPTEAKGEYLKDSFNRKPNPGMLLEAKKDFNLDMKASVLIGDKLSDIKAGQSAGVLLNILFNPSLQKSINAHGYQHVNSLENALDFL